MRQIFEVHHGADPMHKGHSGLNQVLLVEPYHLKFAWAFADVPSSTTSNYPLVMTNSLPWYRWPIYRWFIYQKWWFSIAMLNNQRVHCINWLSVQVCYPHLYSILGISFSHVSMACIDWFPIHKHHISAQPKISFSDVWPPNSKVISGT